jgi:hypothetical protein
MIINIVEGAAAIEGRVTAAEGAMLPSRMQVQVIPMEHEKADDPLRYAQIETGSDGVFKLRNLAPGKYWLFAQPKANTSISGASIFDAATRARLRREAQAINNLIELQPCQRLLNYEVKLKKTPE